MVCNKCGKEIGDEKVCKYCNSAANNKLVSELSDKIKTEAKIWKIVAIVQVVIGAATIIFNIASGMIESALYGVLILVVAFLNFKSSKKDLKYAEDIKTNPTGIVKKYEPLKELIATLVYNVVFGGVVGVVACAFGFLTRKFVVDNKQKFLDIENGCNK